MEISKLFSNYKVSQIHADEPVTECLVSVQTRHETQYAG